MIKNNDGTTSFNYSRIGTTWHYNYADLDVQTQEKIREQTHTKPFVVNGKHVNGGSPTNPITKSANTLNNIQGSGNLITMPPGVNSPAHNPRHNSMTKATNKSEGVNTQTNLNTVSNKTTEDLEKLNNPYFINLNGWTN